MPSTDEGQIGDLFADFVLGVIDTKNDVSTIASSTLNSRSLLTLMETFLKKLTDKTFKDSCVTQILSGLKPSSTTIVDHKYTL